MWHWWPWRRRSSSPEHLRAGEWGEDQAEHYLRERGYRILGRRVRIGRDELDIVARIDTTLVFVEVKTRATEDFGRPMTAIERDKRHSLSRAAVHYLKKLPERPAYFRFDVIEVIGVAEWGVPRIRHVENAFTMDPSYRVLW